MKQKFPAFYQTHFSTPLGLFKSKTEEIKDEQEFLELVEFVTSAYSYSYCKFNNCENGVTVIPGNLLKETIIEIVEFP